MLINWLSTAEEDLLYLESWYRVNAPEYLTDVAQAIWDAANSLSSLPNRARPGAVPGTRELLVPDTPYMLVYVVTADTVAILRLLHQYQKWPPQG